MTSPPERALGRLVWTVAFIALPARPESTQQRTGVFEGKILPELPKAHTGKTS